MILLYTFSTFDCLCVMYTCRYSHNYLYTKVKTPNNSCCTQFKPQPKGSYITCRLEMLKTGFSILYPLLANIFIFYSFFFIIISLQQNIYISTSR